MNRKDEIIDLIWKCEVEYPTRTRYELLLEEYAQLVTKEELGKVEFKYPYVPDETVIINGEKYISEKLHKELTSEKIGRLGVWIANETNKHSIEVAGFSSKLFVKIDEIFDTMLSRG